MMRRGFAALVVFVGLAAAVPAARAQAGMNDGMPGSDKVSVAASFSILQDMVARVGGDRVEVTAVVGRGGDVHVYEPSPADARTIDAARLIVVNGLGFEGWMERLVRASAAKAQIVVASSGIVPRHAASPDRASDAAHLDPHAWQSVRNAERYVSNIRDGLIRADPPARTTYEANAAAYLEELVSLDADIRRVVAAIPPAQRKIVTTHDAFGYFAADYGVEFIAAQGLSGETDPSARDIVRIIRIVRDQHIRALFFENAADPRLARRIAAETGARVGGMLYADTLSAATGPAATYLDMMRYNIREIEEGVQ
jgi:zinc/manganese transport system substrate-binding protein